jgi:hypothetical protein
MFLAADDRPNLVGLKFFSSHRATVGSSANRIDKIWIQRCCFAGSNRDGRRA